MMMMIYIHITCYKQTCVGCVFKAAQSLSAALNGVLILLSTQSICNVEYEMYSAWNMKYMYHGMWNICNVAYEIYVI